MLLEIGNFHSITLPSSNERDIFDSLRFIEDFVKEILEDSLVPGQNRKGKTGEDEAGGVNWRNSGGGRVNRAKWLTRARDSVTLFLPRY